MLKSQLKTHSPSNMVEFKSRLNYQKEIGYGLQSGFYQDINNTVLGQQVDKSILCKVEETLDIQHQLEEDLNHLVQLSIGDQTIPKINSIKLTQFTLNHLVHWLMNSTFMDFIGITKLYIHTLTMIQIKFYK